MSKDLPQNNWSIGEGDIPIDLRKVPFSRMGSYVAISLLSARESGKHGKEGLYVRHLRSGGKGPIFLLEPTVNNQPVPYVIQATPIMLRIFPTETDSSDGVIEFCFPHANQLHFRIRGNNLGLRLTMVTGSYDHVTPLGPIQNRVKHDDSYTGISWEVNSYSHGARFLLTPLKGRLCINAPWDGLGCRYIRASFLTEDNQSNSMAEGLIQDYVVIRENLELEVSREDRKASFERSLGIVERDLRNWRERCPEVKIPQTDQCDEPEIHASSLLKGHALASYITWSCIVRQEGFLPSPAMYMSKNYMANVWSWDHCFNAMALFYKNPAAAWEQFCLFFQRQHPSGVLPDYMNDKEASWNCCKPPIHGWTLKWMMERDSSGYITDDKLSEIYSPLARWTQWWFEYRDFDRDGIPQYNHGNDSGWDNSTVFLQGVPVESPDLAGFLVIQMEVLSHVASRLRKTDESKMWQARSKDLLANMFEHFWDGESLHAVYLEPQGSAWRHNPVYCHSLLPYVTIVLGDCLRADIKKWIVSGLKERGAFMTEYGLATEKITSPHYKPDGYWRGPIWAPATMLIVDGLVKLGEKQFAQDIARRFCHMAAENGMAENFSALSGQPLEDTAFTWTSSVYMILAHEYL